jgi:plastocyanin
MMLRSLAQAGLVLVAGAVAGVADGPKEKRDITQGADTIITIRASGSTLEFTPMHVSAKAGTRLRLRFVNEGTLPHNVVVPKSDDDIDALALAAYKAGDTGYVPMELKEKLVGYTALASPGESVEMTFVVPAAGQYTYVCLFPGHSNNMSGTLRSLK